MEVECYRLRVLKEKVVGYVYIRTDRYMVKHPTKIIMSLINKFLSTATWTGG